jgi:pimeloyl-ACP methyl ester carboxylesterase
LLIALVAAACGDDAQTPSPASVPAANGTASPAGSPAAGGTTTSDAPAKKLGTYSGVATTTKAPDFTALSGAKASFGKLGSAVYRIEMPDKWNGELVLWAHGYRGSGTELSTESPPQAVRKQLIDQGYAWGASSYSENGYTPGIGADDTLALKKFFVDKFGAPKRTYLTGASMGGNVITLSLENFGNEYDGALAVCGALAGEEEIDYLTSWAMVGEYLSGVTIPLGQGAQAVTQALLTNMGTALGAAQTPTDKGKRFANVMQNLTGGPRPFFKEGFVDQYLVNFGLLIADPNRQGLTSRASTNEGVNYHIDPSFGLTDAALNAGVRRLTADSSARDANAHPDAAPTTGRITKPLLTLHGTGDLFVPITQEQSYQAKVKAAGKSELFVARAIRSAGHCKFSDDEYTTAFNDLANWVTTGKKPAGDDISGDLSDIGRKFTTPLRPGDPGNK